MPGPIGFGVERARRAARPSQAPPPGRLGPTGAWLAFVVVTFVLSWSTAGLLAGPPQLASPLLAAACWYALAMGWQPLLAATLTRWVRSDTGDTGARATGVRPVVMAIALALGAAAASAGLAVAAGEPGGRMPSQVGPWMATAALAAFALLWLQAISEEYGWRGAPLLWALTRWGARPGLVLHGVTWGLWYAPLLLIARADGDAGRGLADAAGALITCGALGVILGWLRLRSASLVPAVLVNAILTITAGLPMVLSQGSLGARDAVFRWPGWIVLGALAVAVLIWGKAELERGLREAWDRRRQPGDRSRSSTGGR